MSVVKEIARGGNGFVYLCENENKMKWAIKITGNISIGEKIARILTLLDASNSKNTYIIYVFRLEEHSVGLAMHIAYYPSNLNTIIYSLVMPDDVRKIYYLHLLESLSYIHSRGVIHTDISSDNILCTDGKELRIGDLDSCVEFKEEKKSLQITKQCHRAPEICAAVAEGKDYSYGYAIDVWGLGCVFHQMLVKSKIFYKEFDKLSYKEECKQQLLHIEETHPTLFSKITVSADGKDLITRMLEMSPDKRITVKDAIAHPYLDPIREVYRGMCGK